MRLKEILKDRVVLLGVGNILRCDDGLGPILVKRLEGKISAKCIDAGTTPENQIGSIIREDPDTVLIIDAAHITGQPGEFDLLTRDEILETGLFSTHSLSPKLFMQQLETGCDADVYLLAVQPENTSFGQELSNPVSATLDFLENRLKNIL